MYKALHLSNGKNYMYQEKNYEEVMSILEIA